MEVTYSGINGVDGIFGKEYLRIAGATTVPILMKAFAFEAGGVDVTYSWARTVSSCCLGTAACTVPTHAYRHRLDCRHTRTHRYICTHTHTHTHTHTLTLPQGSFERTLSSSAVLTLGDIPEGVQSLVITITITIKQTHAHTETRWTTYVHSYTHKHTHKHTNTHTHTHTHTHTCTQVITITTGTTTSGPDLDIQLFDKSDGGSPIVGYGLKSSTGLGDDSGEKSATYKGRTYHYSGFNGVDGQLGNEYVRIDGITNTELTMKVGLHIEAHTHEHADAERHTAEKHTYIKTQTGLYTYTHTHAHTHTRTHTHTHTHMYTGVCLRGWCCLDHVHLFLASVIGCSTLVLSKKSSLVARFRTTHTPWRPYYRRTFWDVLYM
jgi:hypothetical protein